MTWIARHGHRPGPLASGIDFSNLVEESQVKKQSTVHRCPFWAGYLLASPLRKFQVNPYRLLQPYVREGMTVLDVGCAMGFFSLPVARLVGADGKVICVDIEERMLAVLKKRAARLGLSQRIIVRTCSAQSLAIDDWMNQVDVTLGMFVVHEIANTGMFFRQVSLALKPKGLLVMAEPKGHVSETEYGQTLAEGNLAGFEMVDTCRIRMARCSVLRKTNDQEGALGADE